MCAAKKIEEDTGKKFDLIFCGKEATDAALGQVGAELSELLGTGVITNVIGVWSNSKKDRCAPNRRRKKATVLSRQRLRVF